MVVVNFLYGGVYVHDEETDISPHEMLHLLTSMLLNMQ